MTAALSRPLELGRAVGHPVWLAALVVLITNDHVLKGAGLLPGWLTGKVSDFAGLFVAPVLLGLLLRARSRTSLLLCHVAVGFGFAALELSPELTSAAETLYRMAGSRWQQWSDPTDLLALATLPVAFAFANTVCSRPRALHGGVGPGSVRTRVLAVAGLVACAASTSTANVGPEDAPLAPDCSDTSAGPPCEGPYAEDACDNGWDDDSDGLADCEDSDCTAACEALLAACAEALPQQVDVSNVTSLSGSTLGQPSLTESDCMGADAPDDLLPIRIPWPGTLVLDLPENHGVSVRTTCSDWRTETVCFDAGPTVEIPFAQAGSYTLVVEALDPLLAASFTIPLELRPARSP